MNNVLVLSNNSVSKTESNGRIHSYFVKEFIPGRLHNFYVRGIPDVEGVKYLSVFPKKALLSKLSLGILNVRFNNEDGGASGSAKASPKSKKIFFHRIRSFAYLNNRRIIKNLSAYIKENNIDTIYLWGCNVPFLYNYAWKLAKLNNIDLITFTGEDYPIKDYNYISYKKSCSFKCFQRRFQKESRKVYEISKKNVFANEELKELYSNAYHLENGEVNYFKSELSKVDRKVDKIKNIIYGGNLYPERANSLFEIASYIEKYKDVVINVYGNASEEIISKLNEHRNIKYHGLVSYIDLLEETKKADLLLHIEGFSKEYIKDCKYAFSTKISDYFALGLPMFVYGSEEISGIKFCKKVIPEFTSISKDELLKLDEIILGTTKYLFDTSFINNSFKTN